MDTAIKDAPYIVSGIAPPSSSPAANWFSNLGTTNTNNSNNIGLQYANAKQAVAKTLSNKGALGMLAVNDSPYYDWLKTKNLDKGITGFSKLVQSFGGSMDQLTREIDSQTSKDKDNLDSVWGKS